MVRKRSRRGSARQVAGSGRRRAAAPQALGERGARRTLAAAVKNGSASACLEMKPTSRNLQPSRLEGPSLGRMGDALGASERGRSADGGAPRIAGPCRCPLPRRGGAPGRSPGSGSYLLNCHQWGPGGGARWACGPFCPAGMPPREPQALPGQRAGPPSPGAVRIRASGVRSRASRLRTCAHTQVWTSRMFPRDED